MRNGWAGSMISMTSPDGDTIDLRLAGVAQPERFTDEVAMDGVIVRTTHRVERVAADRVRVTYRMEISGPAADTVGTEVGPQISGDFPQVLAALVAAA